MLRKREFRRYDRKAGLAGRHAGKALAAAYRVRQVRALKVFETWFVIEQLHLRRTARLKQIDDTFGASGEVGKARHAPKGAAVGQSCAASITLCEGSQSGDPKAGGVDTEKMTSR